MANTELDRATEHDEDIKEALNDAISNGEGRLTAKYFRHALRKIGLCIAVDSPQAWKVVKPDGASVAIVNQHVAADRANSVGGRLVPLYMEIE